MFITQTKEELMKNKKKGVGLGVASMVCGIVGLVLICTPIGGILCIVGLLLAIPALIRNCTGMAVAGLVTSMIGTILFALALLGFNYMNSLLDRSREKKSQTETTIQENDKSNQNEDSAPSATQTPAPVKKKNTKKEKYKGYADKIKVKVYNKKNLPVDYNAGRYSEFIELDYKVVNKSPKAIKGIKGTLKVYDQFEDLIVSIEWNISDNVNSKETKKFTQQGIDYNQFLETHQKLHNEKYKNLIFKYETKQINFSDGYKLKL